MAGRPLVMRHEYWLGEGATLALIAALLLRGGSNYLTTRHLGLFDTQLLAACLLLAAVYLTGSVVPRRLAAMIAHPVGIATWLAALVTALGLIPLPPWRDLWWYSPLLRRPLSDPALVTGAVLLVAAALARLLIGRRELAVMRGHGYRWILEWAEQRPLYARLRARALLRMLGFRG